MLGDRLMVGLLFFYCFLAGIFIVEGHYAKATYWSGAAIITGSVVAMK